MTFLPTTEEDLALIAGLYQEAIAFQRSRSATHYWRGMDRDLLIREIGQQLHWKIVEDSGRAEGGEIACFFSIALQDPLVWDHRDADPSVYLHRIVTNPLFRGKGYVKHIMDWAEGYGRDHGKEYIRLDTAADNPKLNAYYRECGFTCCGEKRFSEDLIPGIPEHYRGNALSLFERRITVIPGPSPSTPAHIPPGGS